MEQLCISDPSAVEAFLRNGPLSGAAPDGAVLRRAEELVARFGAESFDAAVSVATFEHIRDLLFKTDYPQWLWNTMFISVAATMPSRLR